MYVCAGACHMYISLGVYMCVHMSAGGRVGVDDGLIFLILQTAEE